MVEYNRTNNAMTKHVNDTGHSINWKTGECLEIENIQEEIYKVFILANLIKNI